MKRKVIVNPIWVGFICFVLLFHFLPSDLAASALLLKGVYHLLKSSCFQHQLMLLVNQSSSYRKHSVFKLKFSLSHGLQSKCSYSIQQRETEIEGDFANGWVQPFSLNCTPYQEIIEYGARQSHRGQLVHFIAYDM